MKWRKGAVTGEAVSKANPRETPPRLLARWNTADSSTSRKLAKVRDDMEAASGPVIEEDFKPQRGKIKRSSHSG